MSVTGAVCYIYIYIYLCLFLFFFIEACPKRGSVVYIYIHVNLQEKYIQRTHSKF